MEVGCFDMCYGDIIIKCGGKDFVIVYSIFLLIEGFEVILSIF